MSVLVFGILDFTCGEWERIRPGDALTGSGSVWSNTVGR